MLDDRLDPDRCAELLAGMEPIDGLLWRSGQYVQSRMLGSVGRDPAWAPTTCGGRSLVVTAAPPGGRRG